MLRRIFIILTLAGWALTLTSAANGAVRVGPRLDWFYGGGYFHAVAGSGGGWIETINALETFYFQQTDRNTEYVELFDASRDVRVRLYANAMYFKGAADTQFRFFYEGHWDDRRLYNYNLPGSQSTYLSLKTAEIWHWVRNGAPTLYLREISRNNDQVQLYNGAEGLTISLMDNEIWMKKDGFNWFKYASGGWN